MLCSWGFKHQVLGYVFMKRQPDQLSVWEKQAGRLCLHFYEIYDSHSGCTLAYKLISPMFAKHSHSVARVKWLARSMAHSVWYLGSPQCSETSRHQSELTQFQVRQWRESSTTQRFPHLFIFLGTRYSKGIAKACQQHCARAPVHTLHFHCFHTRTTAECAVLVTFSRSLGLTSELKRMQHEVKKEHLQSLPILRGWRADWYD